MYESLLEHDPDLEPLYRGKDPALFHGGDCRTLLRVHQRHVGLQLSGYHPDLPPVEPRLMRRLADARTLMAAAQDLLRRGRKAPGPNGLRLELLEKPELWSLCRALAQAVRNGTYRPGADRNVKIPKEGRQNEFRELTIQNAEDRVVARAAVLILQPLLEPGFFPFSFGFRPGRGAAEALATALAIARAQHRWVWASADVAKAFDRIPFKRFLDTCRMHFPPDVVEFIALIARTGNAQGLRQGSPISPLLCNVFFDHLLDWPWSAQHPDLPLLRYADDLLLLGSSIDEAICAHEALAARATAIATPLKGSLDSSVCDLAAGQSMTWLGYRVGLEGGQPAVRVADHAWNQLQVRLVKAHLLTASPLRACQIVRGWLGYLGPCFPHEDRHAVVERLRQVAADLAFDEIPGESELLKIWNAAHARWSGLYARQAATLPHRVQRVREGVAKRFAERK